MTAIAPNLGKFFASCTKRPATAEDTALLAPGDWISERDCPWAWQFKNSCQDMAIGVWEGKEFFVPHHLLMVCEIIEGRVVEKFFKKPEPKFKVGDRVIAYKGKPAASAIIHDARIENGRIQIIWDDVQDKSPRWFAVDVLRLEQELDKSTDLSSKKSTTSLGIGDRVKWRDAPTAIYQIIKPERGGHVTIELVESNTKPKPPRTKRVALWEIKFLSKRPAIGTDLGFKVGDRIVSKHRLSLGQIFEIAEYPSVYADGLISYESLVTTTNLVLDFDQVSPIEEAEKLFNNQELCLQPDTFIVEAAGIQKALYTQDTNLSGQLTTTQVPQASTESDSQESCSLSKISVPLQTTLFSDSQYQISAYSQHLVQIFPWLVSELDLLEFADNCFLKDSDSFDSNAQAHLSLKTLTDSLAQTTQLPSHKSSKRLQVWGIAAPGNLGMVAGTSPKTENGFSSWAITAEVKVTQPKPTKKSLQEIFNSSTSLTVNSATGEEIEEAFTLTASTPKLGVGNKSHPNTFVSIPVKVYVDGVEEAQESPALCVGGWQHRSPLHRDKRGASFAVLYRAAGGDRIYHDQAPCLRSPNNSGTGAYKIREYQGETYLERPINATEAEQLMGWEVGSTAIGINQEGEEFFISQTQRIKILGNGIIPGEITDILTAIKPMLERKLESEVPENMQFAYRQLRQKGMSHQDALTRLI